MTTTGDDEILHKIYYDPSHPAGLSSAQKLFNAARLESPTLKLSGVKLWLSKQFTYTLHKPARRRFERNPIVVDNVDEQWQADLVDMQEFANVNSGFKYILTVIDVFSKFAWAIPLKTKTGREVTEAFKKIFQHRKPVKLQTDQGKEFLNAELRSLLKLKNVRFFTSLNKDIKCSVVERFNRTLKSRMFKYFSSKGNRKYLQVLPSLVDAYNRTIHRSTKKRPIDVNDGNEREVFKNLYGYSSPREYYLMRNVAPKLKAGQSVRIQHPVKPFDKGYYPLWSDQIFTVKSTQSGVRKPYVKLITDSNEQLPPKFYPEQVQAVTRDLFRVETIIKRRKRRGKLEYLVKWLGYPDTVNSWVDASQVQNL